MAYIKSTIRYAGGKTKALKHILPHIKTDKLVSPFTGGSVIEINLAKNGVKVIGYDVFDILVNYWNVQLNNPNGLYDFLKELTPNKETYDDIKSKLKKWDKSQNLFAQLKTDYYKEEPLEYSNIKGAAYYWFNHNLSYGPMYMGWASKIYFNEKKYHNMINYIKNFTCPNLQIMESSFENSIVNHPTDFLYLDPPYYLEQNKDKDNKMFKGLYPNCNFDIHHNGFDHEKLRDLLHSHSGKFVLSYNNCETIRDWYKDYEIHYPQWSYSYGQGETRIGKNKTDNSPKESHEILIIKK